MDAVAQHGLIAQQAVVQQPVDGAAAVIAQAVVHIVHALGHVDVEAGQAVVGLHHLLKGLVADGEQRVAAEHGGDHGVLLFGGPAGELGVLRDGLPALFLAVPLAHLVAQAGADAQLFAHVLDGEQAAGNLGKAGVMVKNGGHAVPDAVQHGGVGGRPGAVQRQMAVDVPPGALQHLQKVGGVVACDGKTPGQPGIDVGVRVDETRHDDAALRVHHLGVGVAGLQCGGLAHRGDGGAVNRHCAVLKVGLGGVAGDQASVRYQKHNSCLLYVFISPCAKHSVSANVSLKFFLQKKIHLIIMEVN